MRGELGTFSIAEILQLIGTQEKTGVLRVRSKGKSAVLFFETGRVVSARDRRQGARDAFLFYLQENGALGIEGLNRVLEAKQSEGGDTVEIILKARIMEEQKLGEWLSQYARQTLENIVKWETGNFEFAPCSDGLPERAITQPLRLEPILMEALRRKDEVEEIRRFLPSLDTRIKVSEPNIAELQLEEQDAAVLALVDGARTIDEIIEESTYDEVETLDILEKLFALGVISIVEKPQEPSEVLSSSPLRSIILIAAIVVTATVVRFGLLTPRTASDQSINVLRSSVEQFIDSREIQNLHFALDAYRAIKGTYPQRLEDLVAADLLDPGQIVNRYGRPYAYMCFPAENRYILSP